MKILMGEVKMRAIYDYSLWTMQGLM